MIMKYSAWNFAINLEGCNTVVVEEPSMFATVVSELHVQMNGGVGGWLLLKDYEEQPLSKFLVLNHSPFEASLNERKIINALYNEVERDILDLVPEQYDEMERNCLRFFEDVIADYDVEVEINMEIAKKDFLKCIQLRFMDNSGALDNIYSYSKMAWKYLHPETIIWINMRSLWRKDAWEQYIHEMNLQGIHVLSIENHVNYGAVLGEKLYTVDGDWCEIY